MYLICNEDMEQAVKKRNSTQQRPPKLFIARSFVARFLGGAATNSQRDLRPQECAHAGRTTQKAPPSGDAFVLPNILTAHLTRLRGFACG